MIANYDAQLISFAKCVLRALERNADWNADVLDTIADTAYSLDLASHDDEGYFRIADAVVRKPKGK